jgi:hypothetical protein
MKKTFLLLAVTLLTAGAFCQDDTTSVSYVAYLSLGDSYDFIIRKTMRHTPSPLNFCKYLHCREEWSSLPEHEI